MKNGLWRGAPAKRQNTSTYILMFRKNWNGITGSSVAESVEEVVIHTSPGFSDTTSSPKVVEGHLSLNDFQGYFGTPSWDLHRRPCEGICVLDWHEQVTLFYDVEAWNLLGPPTLIGMSLPSGTLIIIHTSHIWPTNKSWILWSAVWGWCCTWVFGNGICKLVSLAFHCLLSQMPLTFLAPRTLLALQGPSGKTLTIFQL